MVRRQLHRAAEAVPGTGVLVRATLLVLLGVGILWFSAVARPAVAVWLRVGPIGVWLREGPAVNTDGSSATVAGRSRFSVRSLRWRGDLLEVQCAIKDSSEYTWWPID